MARQEAMTIEEEQARREIRVEEEEQARHLGTNRKKVKRMRAGRDRGRKSVGRMWKMMDNSEEGSRVEIWEVIGWCRFRKLNRAVSNDSKAMRWKRNSRQNKTWRLDVRETGDGRAAEQKQANGRRDSKSSKSKRNFKSK